MNFFKNPVYLGKLKLKNRVFLAPLAGVSDIPFRRLCQELGAGLSYVEMLSATAIKYNNKRTFEMMARHKSEAILGVQVTGSSAQEVAAAVAVLDQQGFETIDINMGCPVRKVVNAGCGSAILKDPQRLYETVEACRAATSKPLSAKFRLGYTRESINVENTVQTVSNAMVDMYTIHGRTRSESYSVPCDLDGILKGFNATPNNRKTHLIKVANGDIFSYENANKTQQLTGCDAIMISRGALGNPWIFKEILEGHELQPSFAEWYDLVQRHLDYQLEYFLNHKLAAILMRKHLLWYVKGFPNSKFVREILNKVESIESAREVLAKYAKHVPKDFIRYEGFINIMTTDYDPKYEMDRQLDKGVANEDIE